MKHLPALSAAQKMDVFSKGSSLLFRMGAPPRRLLCRWIAPDDGNCADLVPSACEAIVGNRGNLIAPAQVIRGLLPEGEGRQQAAHDSDGNGQNHQRIRRFLLHKSFLIFRRLFLKNYQGGLRAWVQNVRHVIQAVSVVFALAVPWRYPYCNRKRSHPSQKPRCFLRRSRRR